MIFEQTPAGKVDLLAAIKAAAGKDTFVSNKPKSRINYVLCMLPRTGSTMFCSILEKTAALGFPDEYLNPRGVMQHYARQYFPGTVVQYVDILRRERSTANGVFGLKATFDDFAPIVNALLVKDLLSPVRFIYLERQDLVLQAVSAVMAQQSGVWHRTADGSPYRSQAIAEPSFDEAAIIAKLDEYTRMRAHWERFFAVHSLAPLRLTYEGIVADLDAAVRQVAEVVGVRLALSVDLSMAVTARLLDQRGHDWADRIRQKYRARIGTD